jgi:polyisoprenoid-binding protein YceI
MKKMMYVALMLGLLNTSYAVEFTQIMPAKSSLTFGYKQMGVPMEGKFGQFSAQMRFDPAKLTSAQASITVNLASIDTGSAEANDEVSGKLWFNTRAFPTGQFVSSSVKALGGNRYQAFGTLTLKGKPQPVSAVFTYQPDGTSAKFDGTFVLKRLDFAIGEGIWTDLSAVANEIQIGFHLVANAAPAKK